MQSYLKLSCSIVAAGLLGTACKKEVMINPDQSASIAPAPTLSGGGQSRGKSSTPPKFISFRISRSNSNTGTSQSRTPESRGAILQESKPSGQGSCSQETGPQRPGELKISKYPRYNRPLAVTPPPSPSEFPGNQKAYIDAVRAWQDVHTYEYD